MTVPMAETLDVARHDSDDAPFMSIAEIQAAHGELIEGVPEGGPDQSQVNRVREFLVRVAAAGAFLYTADERKAAHGIIAYWMATLYSTGRGEQRTHAEKLDWLSDLRLAEFARKSMDQTVAAAEAAIAAMTEAERQAVSRVLMRVIRLAACHRATRASSPKPATPAAATTPMPADPLAAQARSFEAVAIDRPGLDLLGDREAVGSVVDKLTAAGVLRKIPADETHPEQYTLSYESLTRVWPRLAALSEQRARFRDAVRYWADHSRNRAALIRGQLLNEATTYHDLDATEQDFIAASRNQQTRVTNGLRTAAIVFLCVAAIAIVNWYNVRRAERALELRQSLSYILQITRSLAEVALAENDSEKEVALFKWQVLQSNLAQDRVHWKTSKLADAIDKLVQTTSEMAGGTDDETGAVEADAKSKALNVARQAHNTAIELVNPQTNEQLQWIQSSCYRSAEQYAAKIVDTFEKKPYIEAKPFLHEFWLLYWGEMAVVESPEVEGAMVHFGNQLQKIQGKVQPTNSAEIKSVRDLILRSSPDVRQSINLQAQLTPPNYKLVESSLHKANRAPQSTTRSTVTAEGLSKALQPLVDRRVDKADVEQLRKDLAALKQALNREGTTVLKPNEQKPASLN